jgi:hypothetical protein
MYNLKPLSFKAANLSPTGYACNVLMVESFFNFIFVYFLFMEVAAIANVAPIVPKS